MARKLTGRTRGYKTAADRKRAIAMLARQGWNHFVCYRDTHAAIALQYGWAGWVHPGYTYVIR